MSLKSNKKIQNCCLMLKKHILLIQKYINRAHSAWMRVTKVKTNARTSNNKTTVTSRQQSEEEKPTLLGGLLFSKKI